MKWTLLFCMAVLAACTPVKQRITSSGIYLYSIGDAWQPARMYNLPEVNATDTVFMQDEYEWKAVILRFPEGKVYVEQDFASEELIGRIRIHTPELKLKNKLGVGSTVKNVASKSSKLTITALENFGMFDFYSSRNPNIHFLIPKGNVSWKEDGQYSLDDFDLETKIAAVVVF